MPRRGAAGVEMSAEAKRPIFTPAAEEIAAANMTRFLREVAQDHPEVTDYQSLWRWSVEDQEFWSRLWDFAGVVGHKGGVTVEDLGRMPGARFFPEARLNYARNLLRRRDDHPALVAWNEKGRQREVSYRQLYAEVAKAAAGLRALGIGPGDRVVGFMPNIPETVYAMLGAVSLGATWSSCSPDFGVKGVFDRFGQIKPRVLFTADGYSFAGKDFDSLERVREVRAEIGAIEKIVVVPYQAEKPALSADELLWQDFLVPADEIEFAELPFAHPLYVMYSSGTTGLPKCMVHCAGGALIQIMKEHLLHTDMRPDDKVFYYTTCGWMMWNWLISGLAVGATLILYDGAPMKPQADILLQMAEQEKISIFGVSAKYLALAEKEGVEPKRFRLGALRAILSTGSPLAPESYDWVAENFGSRVALRSISGGTDLLACFALGNPLGPIYRGELQCKGLGMKTEVWDEEGNPLVGKPGELVCTRAFPSMPIYFWNDEGGRKYHDAYFDVYPNVWRHGDWAELTERGGLIIYGRSDATLNPGGVRIGTAEIYRQVEQVEEVVESLVIGQQWDGDVRIVLFVRLRPEAELDEALRERIRRIIRINASPFHVPKKILAVDDIPRTLSGKLTELAVREVVHGRPVKNQDAMANPQALEFFRNRPELAAD
jgi:acetoacetyl-CoA synthetase